MLLTGLTLGLSQEIKIAFPGDTIAVSDTLMYMPPVIFNAIVSDLKKLDNLDALSSTQDSLLKVYVHNINLQEQQIHLLEEKNLILEAKTKRAYLGVLGVLSLFYISNNEN